MRIQIIPHFLILLFFMICSSCTLDRSNNIIPTSVTLKKVNDVVLDNSKPLYGKFVEQFRINKTGDIWLFAERNQDRIFAFDKQGRFMNVLGERGKGPKGIMHVSGFDINSKNEVIIYDAAQRMLKVFDLKGELILSNTFLSDGKLFVHPYGIYTFKDHLLFSVTELKFIHEPHKSKLLALTDYEGTVDTVFGMHDNFTIDDNTYSAENNILITHNSIYTNSVGSPYLQIYNSNTFQQTDYFGEKSASFSIPEKEVHGRLPISEVIKRSTGSSVTTGLYSTEHFIILHMQILTEEFFETTDFSSKKNILVLYDIKTKKFIKEIPVPHTLGAVNNNKLYFIEDFNPDNYTIGIYELIPKK